jgi:U4/U6 small nuclear ribonucleoprotein PRP3
MPVAETKANPYASNVSVVRETGFDGAPKERAGRNFRFNPKGKYVHLANQMRQESLLEALKQRIAESARKAGLDAEFETLEKNIRVSVPKQEAVVRPLTCRSASSTAPGGMVGRSLASQQHLSRS